MSPTHPFRPTRWPLALPPRYWLAGATVPPALLDGAAPAGERVAVRVDGACIGAVAPRPLGDAPVFDLDGAMLFSAFVDPHTHLDKGDLLAVGLAPERDLHAAIQSVRDDYARWTRHELEARIGFALRTAHAHGTRHLLTYCDWPGGGVPLAWQVLCEQRAAWAGRVDMTLVSLAELDLVAHPREAERLRHELAAARGVLGLFVHGGSDVPRFLPHALDLAERGDLRLDFHIDEHLVPARAHLTAVAQALHARGLGTRSVFGHGCALSVLAEAPAAAALDAIAASGAGLVALPFTNLHLQDSAHGRTPRLRGIAPLHEARARGIALALGSDNHRDPFFPGGDLDPLQALALGALAAQLDDAARLWSDTITTAPARLLGLAWDGVLRPGAPADLVLHPGRRSAEVLSRPTQGRQVIRNGRLLESTLPDWRELDGLRPSHRTTTA